MSDTIPNVQWISALRGRFLVFDGPDGSGKSTQFRRMADLARSQGVDVCEVREPGGTGIGEQIRDILLDPANNEMAVTCEMLLYMASRAQVVDEVIGPALQRGSLVLADRFVSSTLAYQGAAGGMPLDQIRAVGDIAIRRCAPDLYVFFDVDVQTAAGRLNPLLDRMEQKGADFHRLVRQGYLDQAQNDPDRHLVIDATVDEASVWRALQSSLAMRLGT